MDTLALHPDDVNGAWRPGLPEDGAPRYVAIADALERDVREGTLPPGTRLPTQRELARALGVTVGTVGRAYQKAERRGLVAGEVGRGTFVRGRRAEGRADEIRGLAEARHELTVNLPPEPADAGIESALADALADVARSGEMGPLLAYAPAGGLPAHRDAGVAWLERLGVEARRARVLVTGGAQHALSLVLAALTRPGDVVLCERLTYPGWKAAAQAAGVVVEPVAVDDDGVVPADLDRVCRAHPAKLFYTVPTLQNPTSSVLPDARRDEVAAVLSRHGVPLLEDDIYAPLLTPPPRPVAARVPDLAFYVGSLSKAVAPGLRVAYLAAPAEHVERLEGLLWAGLWATPALTAEVAARWIADGTAARVLASRRREASARQALAREALAPHPFAAHPVGYQVWLPVPSPWRAEDFVAAARRRGVGVNAPATFVVGRDPTPHAVRLCLGAAPTRPHLQDALTTLRHLLDTGPEPTVSVG